MRANFENLDIYKLSEKLADEIWNIVMGWDNFAKDTVGKQIVRAADSIGANVAEGSGRGTPNDNRRFLRMSRGSLYETLHWLRRSYQRKLLSKEQVRTIKSIVNELTPKFNAYYRLVSKLLTNTKKLTKVKIKNQRSKVKGQKSGLQLCKPLSRISEP
jgi:four helix bundle protein